MFKRALPYLIVALASAVLTTLFQPFGHIEVLAQPGCQTFKETGKTVCGKFLQYWQRNGALAQQGFPLSSEFQEKSDLDGKTYTVQYFERAVFEAHPEKQPPFDVLLSQLGTFQFKAKYPNGEPSGGGSQPTQAPVAGRQEVKGSGMTDSSPEVTLKAGTARFRSKSDAGLFEANLLDKGGNNVAVISQILNAGETNVTVNIPAAGVYLLHIEYSGTGTWSVVIEQ